MNGPIGSVGSDGDVSGELGVGGMAETVEQGSSRAMRSMSCREPEGSINLELVESISACAAARTFVPRIAS